jgi:hypothetical protein
MRELLRSSRVSSDRSCNNHEFNLQIRALPPPLFVIDLY